MPENNSQSRPRVTMKVQREGGKTFFVFEVPDMLKQLYASRSDEIRESESWDGQQFYYCPAITDNPAYKQLLEQYGLFDNYGHAIVNKAGRFNIAFLRTVAGAGKIEVKQDLSFAHVSDQVRQIARFLKAYYEQFLGDWQIEGSTEFQV